MVSLTWSRKNNQQLESDEDFNALSTALKESSVEKLILRRIKLNAVNFKRLLDLLSECPVSQLELHHCIIPSNEREELIKTLAAYVLQNDSLNKLRFDTLGLNDQHLKPLITALPNTHINEIVFNGNAAISQNTLDSISKILLQRYLTMSEAVKEAMADKFNIDMFSVVAEYLGQYNLLESVEQNQHPTKKINFFEPNKITYETNIFSPEEKTKKKENEIIKVGNPGTSPNPYLKK